MDPTSLEQILREAEQDAENRQHAYITTEHLFYVLLARTDVKKIFTTLKANIKRMSAKVVDYMNAELVPSMPKNSNQKRTQTYTLQRVVRRALLQSLSAGRSQPSAVDLLVSMFEEDDCYSVQIMEEEQVTKNALTNAATPADNYDTIEISPILFGRDVTINWKRGEMGDEMEAEEECHKDPQMLMANLNELARQGKIDPLIGREKEVQRCWQVLMRRRKNNVLLIGDAGVGKTALAEGLAWLIVNGKVPNRLKNAVIYSLDLSALVAGTKFRGEMEERVQACMHFLENIPDAILFIDEIHTIIGTGQTSEGSLDISSQLKPALANGSLRCIGTTTHDDYRKNVSKNPGFQRRFLKIDISEPTLEETQKILKGLQPKYEEFHDVRYSDNAIQAAAALAQRYIQERKLPDKAIDVIDEAASANGLLEAEKRVDTIEVEQIESIVAKIGNIPELKTTVSEREQLKNAENLLKKQIFGQDKAVESTINFIKLSRAGLRSANKPVASFLFAGPTGVGKTEIAKQLAKILHLNFVRFDMSEYQEQYSVSRLIGSAPGYVGFDNGGLLTEAIRKTPHCVLLLDEIEKAHKDIYALLLQVMDAATLTDNSGRQADFQNVILIMTSNAGGSEISQRSIGFSGKLDTSLSQKAIEKTFTPEFRNRLDEIIIFNPLQASVMESIVQKFIAQLREQVTSKNIDIQVTPSAIAWLAKHGYDPRFGARPLERLIQQNMRQPLAEAILFSGLENGGVAKFSANSENDEKLTFESQT